MSNKQTQSQKKIQAVNQKQKKDVVKAAALTMMEQEMEFRVEKRQLQELLRKEREARNFERVVFICSIALIIATILIQLFW